MSCTTILVGRKASYDGSTLMARNEDSASGIFTSKEFIVVNPEDQPRHYVSKISKVEIDLPDDPLRYTSMPDAPQTHGIWGEAGINEADVAMTETETITSNPRVLGADPLVKGGIGEEDLLTLVLPYIRSAREGVLRLGSLLEKYGTYEMNGVGFQDVSEIWWFESIGGHHWIAKRVPDDSYVVVPNQLGIASFDFVDAFKKKTNHLCSDDLLDFIDQNHLDLSHHDTGYDHHEDRDFDVRAAFGSHDDADHVYNTPRAWFMQRYLNPTVYNWDGPDADFRPESDDLPWSLIPKHKITIEDVKYVLSAHYQGTPYDPYTKDADAKGKYRPIGINRTNFVACTQLRPYAPEPIRAVEWIAEGCNIFNAFVPFYANVTKTPAYLAGTTDTVTTDNFYWANRLIAALADAHYHTSAIHIERYQNTVHAKGHELLHRFDKAFIEKSPKEKEIQTFLEASNEEIAAMAKEETTKALAKVLYTASNGMKNAFARSDA